MASRMLLFIGFTENPTMNLFLRHPSGFSVQPNDCGLSCAVVNDDRLLGDFSLSRR